MSQTREGRPATNGTAAMLSTPTKNATSVPSEAGMLADLDALATSLSGRFVVQVVVDDQKHRRTTVYRSAAAAERAVKRARHRGQTAHVSLVQLIPVGVVVGLAGGCR